MRSAFIAGALQPPHDFDVPMAKLNRLASTNAPGYGNYVHWYDEFDIGLKENWAAPDYNDSG